MFVSSPSKSGAIPAFVQIAVSKRMGSLSLTRSLHVGDRLSSYAWLAFSRRAELTVREAKDRKSHRTEKCERLHRH